MYKLKLALRYLFKRKISYVAIAAVALCVFIVVIVMTVHSGLVREFKDKNHDFYSDCIVSTDSMVGFGYYEDFIDKLIGEEYVGAASPVVMSIGSLARSGKDENIAVEIMGIDVESFVKVSNFADKIYYNRSSPQKAFTAEYNKQIPGFVPGVAMMGSRDKQGNYEHSIDPYQLTVELSCVPLTAKGAMQKADIDYVNTKTFAYSDDIQTNLANVDARVIFIPIEHAQSLCGMAGDVERVNAIFIKFEDGVDIDTATNWVRSEWNDFTILNSEKPHADLFASVTVQSWKQYRRETIAWMEREQTMLTMLFIMVAITTVFIVFVIFYMIVSHKTRDIGILRSVGASWSSVLGIFLNFAAMIGFLGAVLGSIFGWLFLMFINDLENLLLKLFGFQVFDRSFFAIGDLPNEIPPVLLLITFGSAIAACLIGAFIPSFKAARMKPVDTLKSGAV